MTGASVRVAILSGRPLVEAGLRRMIAAEEAVVAAPVRHVAGWGDHYDVALVDLGAPTAARAETVQQVVETRLPVVALDEPTSSVGDGPWARVVRKVLPLSVGTEELVAALARAADRSSAPSDESSALSERELDILALIASGLGNAEIGAELFLSLNTVKSYIRTAYRKIEVHSRSQAVLWAVDHDLLDRRPGPCRNL